MAPSKRRFLGSTSSDLPRDAERFTNSRSGVQPACTKAEEADEIDHAFETLESGAPPRGLAVAEEWQDSLSQLENTALLREMASGQLQLLDDRMQELATGPTPKRWLGTVRLLLRSLLKAAEALDQAALVPALVSLDLLLERASKLHGASIEDDTREALLGAHARLSAELAQVFEPLPERRR